MPALSRKAPRQGGKQRSVGWTQAGPLDLPAQHRDLVAKHEQLDVGGTAATDPAADQKPQQRDECQIGKGEPGFDTLQGSAQRGAVLARARELLQFARHNGYRREELVEIIEALR